MFMSFLESIGRFISAVLIKLLYRVKVIGRENVPVNSPALIICNHVSYADGPLVDAAAPVRVRFVMSSFFYKIWFLKPFCTLVRCITISSNDPPKKIIIALKQAREALLNGETVCIFAEGEMTHNGNMMLLKNGFQKIVKGTNAPIIPGYIGGMWGSILSCYYGNPFSKLAIKYRRKVSVHFGKAIPNDATAADVKLKIQDLSCDYYNSLKSKKRTLAYRFVKTARRYWRRRCITDSMGKELSYGKTLTGAVVLSKKIRELAANQQKVGIMLPPSVGGALTNIAVTMLGKIPVNLNYTLSAKEISFTIQQCDIKCVITSSKLVKKLPELQLIEQKVFIEDIAGEIKSSDKQKAYLQARFTPAKILAKTSISDADNLATIIFSSGSSGRPKGVMLSHHNIISNIDSMCSVFKIKPVDNLCAILPFFHSFGFTCSLWLPILNGVSSSFVANPLDAKVVGETALKNNSSVLFAAPTFLLNFIRKISPEAFANLRLVMTGAEKLKDSIADSFKNKFGIRPREGYGATELSPTASFNIDDVELSGVNQLGVKEGTVGHPIPGIAVKVIDPQSCEDLSMDQQGLLCIKGPNVMCGYLNDRERTDNVIKDGWYITGDIGGIDEDGFIRLTGRLSRFSKIAGEMIPHMAVEETLHKELGLDGQCLAVTAIPDEKRGEQLIVLYTPEAGDAEKLNQTIADSELPNLYKPKHENFIQIDKIPALASGKLDLMRLKQIAENAKKSR